MKRELDGCHLAPTAGPPGAIRTRPGGLRRTSPLAALILFAPILSVAPAAAQRTDVVVLDNANVITGEIVELRRGKLRFKTDNAGTLSIEWEHVARVTSDSTFEVETTDGRSLFGRLPDSGTDGLVRLRFPWLADEATVEVEMLDVVRITPIGSGFWQRWDGTIELAFGFAKANTSTSWNLKVDAAYVPRNNTLRFQGSSYFQSQDSVETITRNNVSLTYAHSFDGRWTLGTYVSAEQNKELSLDIRASLAGFAGRSFIQSNAVLFNGNAGLTTNREGFTGEETTSNLELLFSASFDWFTFDDHETDLSMEVQLFPSLSDPGRVRNATRLSFKRDLMGDFYIGLSGYLDYDSRPTGTATKIDLGFDIALGWDF